MYTLILCLQLVATPPDDCKCDIQAVAAVYEKLDSLTQTEVDKLLCTFDISCKNNVEYSEFSNEVLFDVLNEASDLFVFGLSKLTDVNQEYVLTELENPVNDKYRPLDLIKKIDTELQCSDKVINALKVAQGKY